MNTALVIGVVLVAAILTGLTWLGRDRPTANTPDAPPPELESDTPLHPSPQHVALYGLALAKYAADPAAPDALAALDDPTLADLDNDLAREAFWQAATTVLRRAQADHATDAGVTADEIAQRAVASASFDVELATHLADT